MHKRHLVLLAASLRKARAEFKSLAAHKRVVEDVADVCARLNPLFKRDVFLAACGVE